MGSAAIIIMRTNSLIAHNLHKWVFITLANAVAVGCVSGPQKHETTSDTQTHAWLQADSSQANSEQIHSVTPCQNPCPETDPALAGAIPSAFGSAASIADSDRVDEVGSVRSVSHLDVEDTPTGTLLLSLEEAEAIALTGNPIIRNDAQFRQGGNQLLTNPEAVSTMLDAELARTGYLFGQRGEQAALSDYDPQLNTQMTWGRNEAIQNNRFISGGILPGDALVEETARYSTELRKNLRRGGQVAFIRDWNYDASNRIDVLFQSVYQGSARIEYRQPVLAGAGLNYGETAGPPGTGIAGVTGVSQGVVVARNQTRISQINLQIAVASLLRDVSTAYWRLFHALESRAAIEAAIQQTEITGDIITARIQADADISAANELDYMDSMAQLDSDLVAVNNQVSEQQTRLTRLLGLEPNDHIQIVPTATTPVVSLIVDGPSAVATAFKIRPELRRQELQLQNSQRQLSAAKNLLMPRLDFVSDYRVNGFGNDLFADAPPGPTQDLQSAYGNLFQGDNTGWQLGFEFVHVFGRRLEKTRVKHLATQVRKDRILLTEQQKEIEFELNSVIQDLGNSWQQVENAQHRLELANKRVILNHRVYEAEPTSERLLQLLAGEVTLSTAKTRLQDAIARYRAVETEFLYLRGDLATASRIHVCGAGCESNSACCLPAVRICP
jgi:outer membrane protein TolC